MTERNLNPPECDDYFPIYWPKGFRDFTEMDYAMHQITGGDTAFFKSISFRCKDYGLVYCEAEIDLRKNPSLLSPMSFGKLASLKDAEFRVTNTSGNLIAEWSMLYERQCANFRVRRDPDEDDGINDVGQI